MTRLAIIALIKRAVAIQGNSFRVESDLPLQIANQINALAHVLWGGSDATKAPFLS
jgi:hypothetical protein